MDMRNKNALEEWNNAVRRWKNGYLWGYQTWLSYYGLDSPEMIAHGK